MAPVHVVVGEPRPHGERESTGFCRRLRLCSQPRACESRQTDRHRHSQYHRAHRISSIINKNGRFQLAKGLSRRALHSASPGLGPHSYWLRGRRQYRGSGTRAASRTPAWLHEANSRSHCQSRLTAKALAHRHPPPRHSSPATPSRAARPSRTARAEAAKPTPLTRPEHCRERRFPGQTRVSRRRRNSWLPPLAKLVASIAGQIRAFAVPGEIRGLSRRRNWRLGDCSLTECRSSGQQKSLVCSRLAKARPLLRQPHAEPIAIRKIHLCRTIPRTLPRLSSPRIEALCSPRGRSDVTFPLCTSPFPGNSLCLCAYGGFTISRSLSSP